MLRLVHAPQPVKNQKTIPTDATAVGNIRREIEVQQDQIGP